MAFLQVAAVDLDGTLTSRDRLSHEALDAISDARRKGLTVVLVTGRIEAELQADFPGIADYFDAVVLENGSVMVIKGCAQVLAEPVDGALDDALRERRLPFRRGEALVAIDGEHATTVVDQSPARIPGSQSRILVTGPARQGRGRATWLA